MSTERKSLSWRSVTSYSASGVNRLAWQPSGGRKHYRRDKTPSEGNGTLGNQLFGGDIKTGITAGELNRRCHHLIHKHGIASSKTSCAL
jgi:hypothetical protein